MELTPEENRLILDILTHLNYKYVKEDWKLIASVIEKLESTLPPKEEHGPDTTGRV